MSMEELARLHLNKMRPGCRIMIDDVVHVVWRRLGTGPNWKTFCDVKFSGVATLPLRFDDSTRVTCFLCLVELEAE